MRESILQFFKYEHLKPELQAISKPFCDLAHLIAEPGNTPHFPLPRNPERSVTLRKLKEAKDAAVCAFLFKEEQDWK